MKYSIRIAIALLALLTHMTLWTMVVFPLVNARDTVTNYMGFVAALILFLFGSLSVKALINLFNKKETTNA